MVERSLTGWRKLIKPIARRRCERRKVRCGGGVCVWKAGSVEMTLRSWGAAAWGPPSY